MYPRELQGATPLEKIDTLLTGGVVITMNRKFDLVPDGAVAICDREIVAVGTSIDISKQYTADKVVDCKGRYILPGLVNAHTHASMTLLRGMADDLRLDVWLMGYVMPTEREFVSPEFCRVGASLACAEMIRGGVTTFADMYYFEADVAAAVAAAGLRGILGETVLKFPAPDAETYEDSLQYARGFIERWRNHPLITPAVAPHAPYSNTHETLRRCRDLAIEYDVPVLIHIAEMRQEEDDCLRDYGMTVVPWVEESGLFDAKVLIAHCVHIDEQEMQIIRKHRATISHNPSANLKLASGIAAVKDMLDHRITVGIGTDGPASNNDLDMFEEMRLAAFLAKTASNDPTALPARQALLMATRQGAEAVFLGNVTGSLEAGKRADVIVVDAQPMHNIPHFDANPDAVYSQLVYAGKSSDVRHVICNGQWLMEDRRLLTVDENMLREQARGYAARIGTFLEARKDDVLSKLLAISGGVERSESFENQVKAVLRDESTVLNLLDHRGVKILRTVRYRQYDTYFVFNDAQKSRVRYREDDTIDDGGNVLSVRSRLTFTSAMKEREFNSTVLLSHSRFIAPADRPLRFYQEYFQDAARQELVKERRRWHLEYKGVLFFLNIDRVLTPALPNIFIELKTRTWSAKDAENKAKMILEMLDILRINPADIVRADYLEMASVAK
jgi:5-methylthioadenosine/S-adenosylhomocysteine deaminase